MIRANHVDRSVSKTGAKRGSIAGAAERRHDVGLGIEPADVDVAQVQMMNRDVARDRQPFPLRRPHHGDTFGRRQSTQMDIDARLPDQCKDRRERDRFGGNGNGRQSETRRDLAIVSDAALGEIWILRSEPDTVSERRGVLHRAKQQ